MHPKTPEQLTVLKAVAKAMKVDFESDNSPYDPTFVAKIQKGVHARESGKKGLKVDVSNLWK